MVFLAYLVTPGPLPFDPKTYSFISVPRCITDKSLVKIHECISQMSQKKTSQMEESMHAPMRGHTDK